MKHKGLIIVLVGLLALVCTGFLGVQQSRNKAISLEEAVETARSDIEVQEKKRLDLVKNLADCVKQYDKHEAEVLQGIAERKMKILRMSILQLKQ